MHAMDGLTNNVRTHYTPDGGSNVADRERVLLETLAPAGSRWTRNSKALFALPCTSPHCRSCGKIS
jgi:hypothetical protein